MGPSFLASSSLFLAHVSVHIFYIYTHTPWSHALNVPHMFMHTHACTHARECLPLMCGVYAGFRRRANSIPPPRRSVSWFAFGRVTIWQFASTIALGMILAGVASFTLLCRLRITRPTYIAALARLKERCAELSAKHGLDIQVVEDTVKLPFPYVPQNGHIRPPLHHRRTRAN